jgi:hypothetical protein
MSGDTEGIESTEQAKAPATVKAKEKKDSSMEEYFRGGLFVLVALLLAISALQFYSSVHDVIYTWFRSEYIPIIRAGFNLAVVVFCLYVIKFHLMKKKI